MYGVEPAHLSQILEDPRLGQPELLEGPESGFFGGRPKRDSGQESVRGDANSISEIKEMEPDGTRKQVRDLDQG